MRSSLQVKTVLLMGAAMAVVLAVALFSLSRVYATIQELDRIAREDFQTQLAISQANGVFKAQVQEWKDVLLRGHEAAGLDKHWAAFQKLEKEVAVTVREARAGTSSQEAAQKLEKFLAAHKDAGAKYREAVEAFKTKGDANAADKLVAGIDRAAAEMLDSAATAVGDAGARATAEAVRAAENAYRFAILGTIAVMVVALVILWLYVRRSVIRPVHDAVAFARRIEQGDLTGRIESRSRDEIGRLTHSLSRMNESLARVVSQVRSSSEAVAAAASQVSAGNAGLSERTEEQASNLEETAASMEELSGTVTQNADNARQAEQLSDEASKRAEQGGAEVVRVVTTMTRISDSSRRIGDIIGVIESIAFQTNILALNAAVEAARAGEQGRGFAVVATEVRSLAQRSSQAAKEIRDLIGASKREVDDGTLQVQTAGTTIEALVADVKRVSELMKSIAEASAEQSRGVHQVNKTVTEMDRAVQSNASAVTQSAAAAEGLLTQADALVEAVSAFRLSDSEARAFQPAGEPMATQATFPTEPALLSPSARALPRSRLQRLRAPG